MLKLNTIKSFSCSISKKKLDSFRKNMEIIKYSIVVRNI